MNKYLKILALTGGTLGCIAPTALRIDNKVSSNDLMEMYENVSNLQPIKPKMSRINYRLNINTSSSDDNVTFTTHDEDGEEKTLDEDETISYLTSTLEEISSEYEHLKYTLIKAIKETMDYLDNAKGNDNLSNEQKIYIKEHTNSIKFLAETLEDLSEDVLCCIDGIECDDCEDDERITAKYLMAIGNLEDRINALQNSLNSLQMINGISNPYFNTPYNYPPNTIIYGLRYGKRPHPEMDNDLNIRDNEQTSENNQQTNSEVPNTSQDNVQSPDNTQINENAGDLDNTTDVEANDDAEETSEDYKTFNLKSNIDTYAPTRRNIDTFFNTALLDQDEYGYGNMYGYGYGMPYGGMMYNGYGNPYGNMAYGEYNSNMINRKVLEDNQNNYIPNNTQASVEQPEETPRDIHKAKDKIKRASNIDTYTGTTIRSNINSMGESKISKFIKDKFNTIKGKVHNKRQQTEQNMRDNQNSFEQGADDTYKYARTPKQDNHQEDLSNQDNSHKIGDVLDDNQSTQDNTTPTDNEQNLQTLPDFSEERAVADIPQIEKVDDIRAR